VAGRGILVSFVACVLLQASTGARPSAASSRIAEAHGPSTRAEAARLRSAGASSWLAAGQTVGATTGAIDGVVTDNTSAVLPGVTITISSDAVIGNRGTRTTVTNGEGLYRFPAVSPGEYTLMFTLQGFRTETREGIYVGVGITRTVNVVVDIAELKESVTVDRQSPVIDRQSTASAINFDARQLANLPGARSMWAIQAATPGVYMTNFDVGGSAAATPTLVSAYGTPGANRPMVEGIHVAGINPTGFTVNYGSFDEVSVGTAAHGAEWQAPGVQMQFISKSGGNRYRATLYADYENKHWQSFNIDDGQISRGARGGLGLLPRDANRLWSYHDINPDVGGYIKPDTLWWYFSFREQDVSARRVNFQVDQPYRARLTNYSGKATYQATLNNKLIAFGQAGRNHQPNLLGGFTLGPAAAVNLSEESTSGGSITAESEPHRGTAFRILLPRAEREPEPAVDQLPEESSISGNRSETVLLVEDDTAVRDFVREVLEREGYSVIETSRADEAIAVASSIPGPIHLLLTDIVMPGMSGRVLWEKLSASRTETRVLFMSGYTDDAVVRHGIRESGLPCLQKPFTFAALAREVRRALDRDRTWRPGLMVS